MQEQASVVWKKTVLHSWRAQGKQWNLLSKRYDLSLSDLKLHLKTVRNQFASPPLRLQVKSSCKKFKNETEIVFFFFKQSESACNI